MKTFVPLIAVLCILSIEINVSIAAVTEDTIKEATTYCEREVPKFCVSTTCPQFCNAIRSPNGKRTCLTQCTDKLRCEVKANTARDQANNLALDAQNRDQLIACIAERRDPNNTKTGRRQTPWKELRTPSFVHAVRP